VSANHIPSSVVVAPTWHCHALCSSGDHAEVDLSSCRATFDSLNNTQPVQGSAVERAGAALLAEMLALVETVDSN